MGSIDPNVLRDYAPEQPLNDMLAFAYERQQIYHRRQAGQERPWTSDEVLNKYKFCNLFRDQDTVTKWIYDWVDGLSGDDLVANLIYARFNNSPETMAKTGHITDWYDNPNGFINIINQIGGGKTKSKVNKNSVWRGAYQVSASFKKLGYQYRETMMAHHIKLKAGEVRAIMDTIQPGDDLEPYLEQIAEAWGYKSNTVFSQVILDYGDLGFCPQDVYVPAGSGVEPVLRMEAFAGMDYHALVELVMDQWASAYPDERPMLPKDAEHTICEYRKYVCWTHGLSNARIYRG